MKNWLLFGGIPYFMKYLTCDLKRQHWLMKAQVTKGPWDLCTFGEPDPPDQPHMAGSLLEPPDAPAGSR